jgi:phage tail-like protein
VRWDPYPAYWFEVNIPTIADNTAAPSLFKSCDGLDSETDVQDVAEGGRNGFTRKLVGQTKFGPINLSQGFCVAHSPLYKYRELFLQGKKPRFNFTIKQKGPNDSGAIWEVRYAWISKWSGPKFEASKNEISIEQIVIVHEGLVMHDKSWTDPDK